MLKKVVRLKIEQYPSPVRYVSGEVETHRIYGYADDGTVAWTGLGFASFSSAQQYAEAFVRGAQLTGSVVELDLSVKDLRESW